jgi:hypothetical protein
MLWLALFLAALVVCVLKRRNDLMLWVVGGAIGWVVLVVVLGDELPDLVLLAVALVLLAPVSAALFTEPTPGSTWDRWNADAAVSGVGRILGVVIMVGLVVALAVGFAADGNIGGTVFMGAYGALVAYVFLIDAWVERFRGR